MPPINGLADRPLTAFVAVVAVALLAAATVLAARRLARVRDAAQSLLTFIAAGIATAVAINGMWRVFGDALHMPVIGRVATCAFLEVALLASALRARANLRDTGSVGVDGGAVWVIALASASLSSADSEGLGRWVRFGAPLLAAWLWERGLAAERRKAGGQGIAWRLTLSRIAVWAGLADPAARDGVEVNRARLLARLTMARIRVAALDAARPSRWTAVRRVIAERRLRRLALAAVEHIGLGVDTAAARQIRSTVATVMGLKAATEPDALASVSPWGASRVAPPAAPPTGQEPTVTTPSPRANVVRRPRTKRQVNRHVPAGLSRAEEDILVHLLGVEGWAKRADIVASCGGRVSTVKAALGRLAAKGHVVSRGDGHYRSTLAGNDGPADVPSGGHTEVDAADTDDPARGATEALRMAAEVTS